MIVAVRGLAGGRRLARGAARGEPRATAAPGIGAQGRGALKIGPGNIQFIFGVLILQWSFS